MKIFSLFRYIPLEDDLTLTFLDIFQVRHWLSFCSRLSFQGCLYSEQLEKRETVSPCAAKGGHASSTLKKFRFPELRSSPRMWPPVSTGSIWSSSCCSVGLRSGEPAQNVHTVATYVGGRNKQPFMWAASVFILQVIQNLKPLTFLDNLSLDISGQLKAVHSSEY